MPDSGNLINGETLHGSFTIGKQNGTLLTLETATKYVQKTIELTLNAQGATPAYDGGALNNKGASAVFTNMATSATNTSGVAITAQGTAGRDAVSYDGAVDGWVTASDDDTASDAVLPSTWNGTTYYATGITLGNGKSFNISCPNSKGGASDFTFSIDSYGIVTLSGNVPWLDDNGNAMKDDSGNTIYFNPVFAM